ncbi:MAG: ribonuclease/clavin/mitogillin [Kiritimatiellia bacterium]|jgi:ribonuclease/clavin/mitogillin
MATGVDIVSLRTPTLPPATHTNCWIVGLGDLLVIDPASPWEDEQGRLADRVDERLEAGEEITAIVLTHHHRDHVSGAMHLKRHLADQGMLVPILAHPANVGLLPDDLVLDRFIDDKMVLEAGPHRVRAHHTPGHAAGHLVFEGINEGWLIAGDMVAGVGTILVDPDEGDLGDYLTSLEHMRSLRPSVMFPSHGPTLHEPEAVLSMYIAHRHMRTGQIRDALAVGGEQSPIDLVAAVYPELHPLFHPLGAKQILAHLHWMRDQGLAHQAAGGWSSS